MMNTSILVSFLGATLLALSSANPFLDPLFHLKRELQKKYQGDMVNVEQCGASAADREACGQVTRDERECRTRGCCFENCRGPDCDREVPWCFLPHRMMTRSECRVDYKVKDDCGYYGITEGECLMRGCCYRPSSRINDPPCFHPQGLRLVGGSSDSEGRVEVYHDDKWGTVCDDSFGFDDATVVCKQLGFVSGIARGNAHFGEGSGDILMDEVRCDGNEPSIHDCDFGGWGRHDCSHSEDAGVICSMDEFEGTPPPDYYETQPPDYHGTPTPDYY